MTPEGKVKAAVRKRLEHFGLLHLPDAAATSKPLIEGFFFMPVAGPYSVHGIHDFVGCWRSIFFSMETKAPDNREDGTAAQIGFQDAVARARGFSFIGVRDASAVDRLRELVLELAPDDRWQQLQFGRRAP